MSNEQGGNGKGGDDDFSGPDDPTVVLVSEDFVVGAISRLGESLRRAGSNCDDVADLFREGSSAAAIDDADADLEDVQRMIEGARRALARVKHGLSNGTSKETP